jgi:LCP family protein required for cell wall assembly
MMILALGIDRRQLGYEYGLADVIRVVRADFVSGEVTVLTLPRDLWVKIPGLEEKGITEAKLNTAYFYGSEYFGAYDDPDYGPGFMIDTLSHNYNLFIDRYLTVNMPAFEEIIDAVGGVDVYLPYDVDGKSIDPEDPFDLGFFPAGSHHFDGETASRFARIRMMDNDYLRTTRQTMVLKALWKKIITPSILPRLPELIAALSGSVQMDFKPKDIRPLACLLPVLDNQTLKFVSLPEDMLQETRQFADRYQKTLFIIKVDESDFKRLMGDFQRGVWPTPEPLPSPTP